MNGRIKSDVLFCNNGMNNQKSSDIYLFVVKNCSKTFSKSVLKPMVEVFVCGGRGEIRTLDTVASMHP